jgi:TrmH family RNA methyltransferase
MKHISSRQNVSVSRYRGVTNGDEPGLLLLDGPHLVADALDAGIHILEALVAAEALEVSEINALVERLEGAKVEVTAATAPVMNAVSPVRSTSRIVAIAARPALETRLFARANARALVVIACDVQDPGNVGAIIRVAEAAGGSGVVAAGQCADPLRGSMGSALRLPVAIRPRAADAIDEARQHGCRIVATVPGGGRNLFDVDLRVPVAVLIGSEGHGLTSEQIASADERVTVPMQPPVDSLNAAVAASLILYEALRQRSAAASRPQERRNC